MSLSYVSEKLTHAVSIMVTSPASIQKRLEYAAMAAGTLSDHQHDADFPNEELAEAWNDWWMSITYRDAPNNEGTIKCTLSQMGDDEASKVAEELFNIFFQVEYYYSKEN